MEIAWVLYRRKATSGEQKRSPKQSDVDKRHLSSKLITYITTYDDERRQFTTNNYNSYHLVRQAKNLVSIVWNDKTPWQTPSGVGIFSKSNKGPRPSLTSKENKF